MAKRHFLMLQGVCSPFFKKLGTRLQSLGYGVHKVDFNSGDCLYSIGLQSYRFRQHINDLPEFLNQLYKKLNITDQIIFGDRRPLHVVASEQAKLSGIRNHVFEEGYFRPYWITLEQCGVNARSGLPREANWYLEAAEMIEPLSESRFKRFQSPFWRRAWHDIRYHSAGMLNPILFPSYQTHSNVIASVEYTGYAVRLPKMRLVKQSEAKKIDEWMHGKQPYFVLPLQLNSDAQVRDHSMLNSMPKLIEYVVQSFAKYSSQNALLIIKNHPLDIGLINYNKIIYRLAQQYDVTNRIKFIETGDLNRLFYKAKGVVTLNSTAGMVALEHGCPTITLGNAIYNIDGLTTQTGLNEFWTDAHKPDPTLFNAFKSVVIQTTQVNGGFYCPKGIDIAVESSLPALTSEVSLIDLLKQKVESRS